MEKMIDPLTGLESGMDGNAEIEGLLESGDEFSLILLDIDNLFAINRDFGRDAGDEIFRVIAKHICGVFPAPCKAYRDTRDQFDVLLPGVTKEEAFLKAEQLRASVRAEKLEYVSDCGAALTQSISVGVSSFPEDGSRAADIYRRADSALLRAKKAGRNQVCLSREEKLIPKTSHYAQSQLEKLSLISEKLGVGEASLLREALDALIKTYDAEILEKIAP